MTVEAPPRLRSPQLDDLLQHAVDEAVRLLEADGAIINLVEEERRTLRWSHGSAVDDDGEQRWLASIQLRVGEGIFGRAVAEGELLATGDYLADGSFPHNADSDEFAR